MIKAVIQIIRPLNFVITFLAAVTGALLAESVQIDIKILIITGLSAALTASGGNVINDIFDIPIDMINRPQRPLPSGRLGVKTAYFLYIIFNITALVLAASLNVLNFVVVLFAINLLYFYSAYLKKIPLLGNISIALLTGFVFIFGAAAVNNPAAGFVPAIFAFLINLIREIVKDIEDIAGDINSNVKTFPFIYGIKRARILVLIISLLLMVATFHPYINNYYRIEYFITVMVLVNPLIVLSLKMLYDEKYELLLGKISGLLKLAMIFGLIAIFFGQ